MTESLPPKGLTACLVGGGLAGTSVDVALFPLDTIKTRMQSAQGFLKAGGFRGIYSGLSAAAIGSAPGAAFFFGAYEMSKNKLETFSTASGPVVHMVSACIGETAGCLVRVPTEIVKQRMQTGVHRTAHLAISSIVSGKGIGGLYTGYFSMLAREIPFSLIQFPIWEQLKYQWGQAQEYPANSLQGALCGSLAGSFAAAVTTPLDVAKTRLMLGKDVNGKPYTTTLSTLKRIYIEEGPRKLFLGVGPRTAWIGVGGFVFFGVYEKSTEILSYSIVSLTS